MLSVHHHVGEVCVCVCVRLDGHVRELPRSNLLQFNPINEWEVQLMLRHNPSSAGDLLYDVTVELELSVY